MNASVSSLPKGLSLYPNRPASEVSALAHFAEEVGYSHLWFGDSQNIWRELYTTMAAAAVGTSKIVMGTGVTNGVTRHRSVIASAWATLHELTDGRVAAGFGVGDSAVHTMGVKPMKVAELERFIDGLRELWRGDEIADDEGASSFRLDYLKSAIQVPVYLAASGPRLLGLAGKVADGVILLAGTDLETVVSAREILDESARKAGRDPADIDVVLWAPVAIHPDSQTARNRVRAHVSRTVLRPIRMNLTPEEQRAVERIREEYDYYEHMVPDSPHSELVIDALVDRFAIAGTHAECQVRLRELAAAGINQVAMIPFPGDDSIESLIREFAAL